MMGRVFVPMLQGSVSVSSAPNTVADVMVTQPRGTSVSGPSDVVWVSCRG